MNTTNDICDLLERAKLLEVDHEPDGWPAVQMRDITLLRKEIEDMQGLLLWALWHHQGASSPVGQPIRKFMGIGQHDALLVGQVHYASEVAARVSKHELPPPDADNPKPAQQKKRQSCCSGGPQWGHAQDCPNPVI